MGFRLSTIRSASQKLGGDSVKAPMKFRVWCNELCRRKIHIICTMSADDQGLAVPWLIPPVIGLSPWHSVPICGQSMRELRWTNWHKNRVFSGYFSFALSIAFHERSVLIPSLPTQTSAIQSIVRHRTYEESWIPDRDQSIHSFVNISRMVWSSTQHLNTHTTWLL